MTITAFCDNCGKKIRVGKEYAGKKVKCLHCGHVLILPKREAFLSDPHADFSERVEESEHHEEDRPARDARDVRDMPPEPPPPPPAAASAPAAAAPVSPAAAEDAAAASDLVRGLQFGFGFWLAALPFLLLLLAITWVLFKFLK